MSKYRKYSIDVNYFNKIDNRNKAYWLGFLYADGTIHIRYNNKNIRAVNLELTLKDIDILEEFKKDIKSDAPIKEKITNINGNKYINSRLIINNTEFCKNLINLGCVPNKTSIITFPTENILPKDLQVDFIRGYFDGDGCIYVGKDNQIQINILGTYALLYGISKIFEEKGNCHKGNIKKHPKSNIYQLDYHGNKQAYNIFKILYNNEPFCMMRKKEKFYSYFKINYGSYKYFQNNECEAFPCHTTLPLNCHNIVSKESFNCLFCYCPLYPYMDCGGKFKTLPNKIKDCSDCLIPHDKNNYDLIISKIKNINKLNKGES